MVSIKYALIEATGALVGAGVAYYGGKYIPVSGLVRLVLGFVIAIAGVYINRDGIGMAIVSFGAVIMAQGFVGIKMPFLTSGVSK